MMYSEDENVLINFTETSSDGSQDETKAFQYNDEFPEPPLFPDANFQVGFKRCELNDLLSIKDYIVLKIVHGCYCYDETSPRDDLILLVQNRGMGIRIKDCIWEMILRNYIPECEHRVLTMFRQESDILYRAVFHSENEGLGTASPAPDPS
jgi:hypothetical protein